jgi:hypothetical protein
MVIYVKTVGTLKTLEEGTRFDSLELPEQRPISQVIERLNLQD